MSSKTSQSLGSSTVHKLRKSAPEYEPLLALPDEFSYWDIDDEMDEYTWQRLTSQLFDRRAIIHVETISRNVDQDGPHQSHHRAKVYRWNPRAKEILKDALDHDETLPCGHRVHIMNHGDGTFGCRYCEDDRHYDRDTIERLL